VSEKRFDPTLKTLVEIGPADWLALVGIDPAPVAVIDADVAAISGSRQGAAGSGC